MHGWRTAFTRKSIFLGITRDCTNRISLPTTLATSGKREAIEPALQKWSTARIKRSSCTARLYSGRNVLLRALHGYERHATIPQSLLGQSLGKRSLKALPHLFRPTAVTLFTCSRNCAVTDLSPASNKTTLRAILKQFPSKSHERVYCRIYRRDHFQSCSPAM